MLLFDEYELLEDKIQKGKLSHDLLRSLAGWMESFPKRSLVLTGSERLADRPASIWAHWPGKSIYRKIGHGQELAECQFNASVEPVGAVEIAARFPPSGRFYRPK